MTFKETAEESRDIRVADADRVQVAMHQLNEHLRVEMRQSQDIMEEGANRKRLPAPRMQEGTKLLVDARHIRTTSPSRKLDWKRL
jgi:hypothetical protein